MIAADRPVQRPADARLLAIDAGRRIQALPRQRLATLLRRGDLLVANDAATLPASLAGRHEPSGRPVEVRLAAWGPGGIGDVSRFAALLFGAGNFRQRTEERPPPPALGVGDRLALGPLAARIVRLLAPRLAWIAFDADAAAVWAGLARHGRPVQYAHLPEPVALWDMWTAFAGPPAAFEPPSAGFAFDWRSLAALQDRGIGFATLTHAAGLSSTGDPDLDRLLPLDEAFTIPATTAAAIAWARAGGGRVIAVGTTVVRALETAAASDGRVRAGPGVATGRIGPASRLRVVDAVFSGTHEPGSSHYDLLGAFADAETLDRADRLLATGGYRTHEFGDSVLVERAARAVTAAGSASVQPALVPDASPISLAMRRNARA